MAGMGWLAVHFVAPHPQSLDLALALLPPMSPLEAPPAVGALEQCGQQGPFPSQARSLKLRLVVAQATRWWRMPVVVMVCRQPHWQEEELGLITPT